MNGAFIQMDKETEQRVREIFPVSLSDDDLEWAADWLMMCGIGLVNSALAKHPEMTLGDLINLTFEGCH